jgi:hypothetical protein
MSELMEQARGHHVRNAEVDDLRAKVAQLEAALDSRVVIEQAKGILTERHDLSIDDAFELLRYAARTARMRIHELAAEVVDRRGSSPTPIVVALARTARWRASAQRERAEASRERAAAQRSRAAERARKMPAPPEDGSSHSSRA